MIGLTQLLQHLVTLVQNKVFQILQTQLLALDQGEDAARSSNNNVRTVVLQHLLVLGDGHASEEDSDLDILEELAEPLILLADLEGELPGVAHDQHRDLTIHWLNLLERGQHEDCSLAHPRLGLAQNIHTQHRLYNMVKLDLKEI